MPDKKLLGVTLANAAVTGIVLFFANGGGEAELESEPLLNQALSTVMGISQLGVAIFLAMMDGLYLINKAPSAPDSPKPLPGKAAKMNKIHRLTGGVVVLLLLACLFMELVVDLSLFVVIGGVLHFVTSFVVETQGKQLHLFLAVAKLASVSLLFLYPGLDALWASLFFYQVRACDILIRKFWSDAPALMAPGFAATCAAGPLGMVAVLAAAKGDLVAKNGPVKKD